MPLDEQGAKKRQMSPEQQRDGFLRSSGEQNGGGKKGGKYRQEGLEMEQVGGKGNHSKKAGKVHAPKRTHVWRSVWEKKGPNRGSDGREEGRPAAGTVRQRLGGKTGEQGTAAWGYRAGKINEAKEIGQSSPPILKRKKRYEVIYTRQGVKKKKYSRKLCLK